MLNAFRSALFSASLMLLFGQHFTVQWLDAQIIMVTSSVRSAIARIPIINLLGPSANADTKPIKALVFTIQQDLFEKEFRSRSPIDRQILLQYLQKLIKVYNIHTLRELKVLAIDYDLSPNSYNLSDERDKCTIADHEERAAQNQLDEFLVNLQKEQRVNVILSKHIPVKTKDICRCKLRWEQEMSYQGLLFGHPVIVHSGLFGPVLQYAEYPGYNESFSAVVLAAEHGKDSCDDVEQLSHQDLSHASLHPINYVQAFVKGDVKVCQLNDEKGFNDCKRFFQGRLEEVSTIFFGGAYGGGDTHLTPLGVTPGVTVQAYTYLSMRQRLQSEYGWTWWGAWFAWLIDIGLGSIVGWIFNFIWQKFHLHRKKGRFAPQVNWASINFIFLIILLLLLTVVAAKMLEYGLWINPVLIVIGLFIGSYIAAATTTGEGEVHGGLHQGHPPSPLYALFGIPSSPSTLGPKPLLGWELVYYGTIKIALFWIVFGLAVYMLVTHQ